MDVVVVLVLPAWSRALATTVAFSDRLANQAAPRPDAEP